MHKKWEGKLMGKMAMDVELNSEVISMVLFHRNPSPHGLSEKKTNNNNIFQCKNKMNEIID